MPIPLLGLLVLTLLLSVLSPTTSCTEQEKSSLLQFLHGLSPDSSKNLAASWQNDTTCCMWEGITCGTDGTVTEVSLASNGLEGSISSSLGNLTSLLHLNLSHNSLSGGLPLELVSLSSIIVLDVSFNHLTGGLQELPYSAPIQPLHVLNISSNLFTGKFPSTTWGAMKSLIVLNASNNGFTGPIPSSFCISAPRLTVLGLCYNKFSDSIPLGLGGCSRLRVLKAGHNNLSGTLPDELFNATSLECLDLGGNRLSGKIPDSIVKEP